MQSLRSLVIGLACVAVLTPAVAMAQDVSPGVQALYSKAQSAQAQHQDADAIADYRRILQLAPDLPAAYNNLGRLLFNAGRFSESVDVLKKGLRLDPEMHPAQVMLGASLLQMGRYADAVSPLSQGVAAMPQDKFARLSLARAEIGVGKPEDALANLNAILATDPKDQETWYLIGKLHLQLSQQAFEQVQTIDSNSALAHQMEGEIMESMQNTPGAIAAYKQALQKSPDDPAPRQHLANLYWSTGDWAKAKTEYTALVQQQPGNCMARWKLANAMNEGGDAPEDSLKVINTALSECPSLVQARAERARILIRLNRFAEALPDLKQAESKAPDEPSVQQLLARTYRALGQPEQAAAANKRYVELQQAIHAAKEQRTETVMKAVE